MSYDGDVHGTMVTSAFAKNSYQFNSTYLRPLNIYLLTFREPRFRTEKPIWKIPTHPRLYTWGALQ